MVMLTSMRKVWQLLMITQVLNKFSNLHGGDYNVIL